MKRLNKYILVVGALFTLHFSHVTALADDIGTYNMVVQGGSDFRLNLTFYSDDKKTIPVNLSGYSFKAQIRKAAADVTPFATFSSAVTNSGAGTASFWLTRAATAARANSAGIYDIRVTDPAGNIAYWIKGAVQFLATVTR
jgi:hypothetical protein